MSCFGVMQCWPVNSPGLLNQGYHFCLLFFLIKAHEGYYLKNKDINTITNCEFTYDVLPGSFEIKLSLNDMLQRLCDVIA